MLVLRVAALVDVEAAVQQYTALRRLPVLELFFAVVVLEAGEAAGRLAAQHEVLLLHCLELLQVAAADHGSARGRRWAPARGHRQVGEERGCDREQIPRARAYNDVGSSYHSHGIPTSVLVACFPPLFPSTSMRVFALLCAFTIRRGARCHTCAAVSSSAKDRATHNSVEVHRVGMNDARRISALGCLRVNSRGKRSAFFPSSRINVAVARSTLETAHSFLRAQQ